MAQTTRVIITDDLDGTEGARTYAFSWQGTGYEVDLTDENRDEFLRVLQPYISAGRKTGSTRRRATTSGAGGSSDSAKVRAWAKANGHKITDRGRIPEHIQQAYDAAH
ncbi:histone-like nucleoid-structuring protein Lsr2 [Cellulomonas bogoriensis]|uniref:Lsr2 family protein n=1 Tax=Cellulomonas bogoriensis 69B4 = DSM 16987 TaxID=1386082 RepID=A0A0A0C105_9CELL|nr:Lsr2 family protein [Cellulomonas bogoriensis]KGM13850.1 hypothetical protein N869_09150 [Cellulomonas bogoriensis 69B4 = DSM 16987]